MNLENNKTLFVGLWNPQDKYSKTRHNIGADILIRFCKKNNLEFKLDKNSIYNFSSAEINGSNVEIILPMVSMNNSGDALKSYFKYNNKEKTELVVIHDDIDLDVGAVRLKFGGGHGGHNGLRDIINHLGKNYWRLRIGVGHPGEKSLVHNYVLNNPSKDEELDINIAMNNSFEDIDILLDGEFDKYTKILHTRE